MKPRQNRCRHDHKHAILTLALTPIELTEVFWRAKISGSLYNRVKQELLNAKLIELNNGKFQTTEKGKAWLRAYKRVTKLGEVEK